MKKILAWLIFLCIVGFGIRQWWYASSLQPVDPDSEVREIIQIPSGATVKDIAALLEEKEVIHSAWAFASYVQSKGVDASVQAGSFVLNKAMDVAEIVEALTKGATGEVVLTIPEGYTVKDIDALLVEKGLAKEGETITCAQTCDFSSFAFLPKVSGLAPRGGKLEGYLYPDTYFVTMGDFQVKFFLERLLGTFRTRVVDAHAADIKASKRTLHELVTMASLIEEETRTDAERPIVSGILWKRFDASMGLGVDAAVRYILNKPTATITTADLNVDSPYNLRKFRGLPPGPIANPSLKAFEAALAPEESAYFYYLHDTKGIIHYAVTNDEHNANRARYLQ